MVARWDHRHSRKREGGQAMVEHDDETREVHHHHAGGEGEDANP